MRAACLGGTGEQQEDYWGRPPWQRTSSPVGARGAWVSTASRRTASQAEAARVGLTVPVAADSQASPGDELQAVTPKPPAGTGANPATGPGAVSTGCPGADPGAGR
jgi:hypothetical protein